MADNQRRFALCGTKIGGAASRSGQFLEVRRTSLYSLGIHPV